MSVTQEYLEREYRRVQETPTYENTFKHIHLNMKTQQDVWWLSLEQWDACGGDEVDEAALEGRECYAGLNLSTTTDVSALVLLFRDDDGGMTVLPRVTGPRTGDTVRVAFARANRNLMQSWFAVPNLFRFQRLSSQSGLSSARSISVFSIAVFLVISLKVEPSRR